MNSITIVRNVHPREAVTRSKQKKIKISVPRLKPEIRVSTRQTDMSKIYCTKPRTKPPASTPTIIPISKHFSTDSQISVTVSDED